MNKEMQEIVEAHHNFILKQLSSAIPKGNENRKHHRDKELQAVALSGKIKGYLDVATFIEGKYSLTMPWLLQKRREMMEKLKP